MFIFIAGTHTKEPEMGIFQYGACAEIVLQTIVESYLPTADWTFYATYQGLDPRRRKTVV